MFDTVYVSMYKYFNAASGAVLAGPKNLLEGLFHTRRMFGGGLSHVWPFAAVALHYFEGFQERFQRAVTSSERVIAGLQSERRFELARIPNGTNIFSLRAKGVSAQAYQQRAQAAGILLTPAQNDWFTLSANETWNRLTPQEILDGLRKALG
jgi:threonine aldolase